MDDRIPISKLTTWKRINSSEVLQPRMHISMHGDVEPCATTPAMAGRV